MTQTHHIKSAVVVCTRHRPRRLVDTLQSIAQAKPAEKLVIVVDQSREAVPASVPESMACSQVIWIATETRGLSVARNIGVAEAARRGAEFVAFTDDDCVVDQQWMIGLIEHFELDPTIAMVFGSTRPGPHDSHLGVIPGYIVQRTAVYRGIAAKAHVEAMGACMAVRLQAVQAVGGFDEALGAGAPLRSAEEYDLSARLLIAGYGITETTQSEVLHGGFRHRGEASDMMTSYLLGSGAATAKMMRLGGMSALWPLAVMARRWVTGRTALEVDHLPPRFDRLRAFLQGAKVGFTTPIDPATGCFLTRQGRHRGG